MACTTKADLIELTIEEYTKLRKLIDPLDELRANRIVCGVSVKDIVGHRGH